MNSDSPFLFDRTLLRARRNRLAVRNVKITDDLASPDFLFQETADILCDRLLDVKRDFSIAAELGARNGLLNRIRVGRGKIEHFLECDLSFTLLRQNPALLRIAADEEMLPFRAQSLDLVLSNLSLHWVNDLPGALIQIRNALKSNGLFLGSLFGAGTLFELRHSLIEAEIAERGGASARVAPFASLRDAASLLQRTGFALPVADQVTVRVTYENAFKLFQDLRAMGETNILIDRPRHGNTRAFFAKAASFYHQNFADKEGRIPATFEILFLTGWAEAREQMSEIR